MENKFKVGDRVRGEDNLSFEGWKNGTIVEVISLWIPGAVIYRVEFDPAPRITLGCTASNLEKIDGT